VWVLFFFIHIICVAVGVVVMRVYAVVFVGVDLFGVFMVYGVLFVLLVTCTVLFFVVVVVAVVVVGLSVYGYA